MRCLAIALLLWPAAVSGQVAATDGVIEGRIYTSEGAPVPGAGIRAANSSTGYTRAAQTDGRGRYRLSLLPPGEYTLVVTAADLASVTREGVLVQPGEVLVVNLRLPPLAIAATVVVSADSGAIADTQTVLRQPLDQRVIRDVPVLGRSILELFTLQPGINARPLPTTGSGTAMPVMTYGGLSVRQINVDGVTNTLQGGPRNVVISQEAIERVDTVLNFSAEFGRVAGAIQNLVTRAGGLTPRGSLFGFMRHRALSARPHLLAADRRKPDFARYNAGGSIGGPLAGGRVLGFASYERWMQDNPVVVSIDPDAARQLDLPARDTADFIATFRAHTVTGRIDATLSDAHRVVGRVNYYHNRQSPLQGGLRTRSIAIRFDESPHSATAQLASVLTPRAVNELRIHQVRRRISNGLEADPFAPNITVSGIASFNGNADGHRVTVEEGWQAIENVTLWLGRHTLKAGLEIVPMAFEETTPNTNGTFVFGGLTAVPGVRGAMSPLEQYLATVAGNIDPATGQPFTYSRFTQMTGALRARSSTVHGGYFLQDDVLLGRLRVSAGLRYERFSRPAGQLNPALPATGRIPEDGDNWAPRLAAAFDLGGDGSTVLRGGWGRYFTPVTVGTYNTYRLGNGLASTAVTVTPGEPDAPAFTRSRVAPVARGAAVSDVYVFHDEFEDLEVSSWFVTLERRLGRRTTLALSALGSRAGQLPLSLNVNLAPAGVAPAGTRLWSRAVRPDPRFGNVFVAHSIGESRHRGFLAVLTHGAPDRSWARIAYHLSKTDGIGYAGDTAGFGILTVPSDPQDPARDRGPGDFDMRQRLTAIALHRIGAPDRWWSGWEVSVRAVLSDGFRFNAVTGTDDNGDTQFNDRPPGVGYNAFRLPPYVSVDLRLSRAFRLNGRIRLDVLAEVFNLTNHLNATGVNPVWGPATGPAPTFGEPTQAEASRQGQLGVRLSF